jgi:hypothetical protein
LVKNFTVCRVESWKVSRVSTSTPSTSKIMMEG